MVRGGLCVLYSLELGARLLLNFGHNEHKEGTKFTTARSSSTLSVKIVASVSSVFHSKKLRVRCASWWPLCPLFAPTKFRGRNSASILYVKNPSYPRHPCSLFSCRTKRLN